MSNRENSQQPVSSYAYRAYGYGYGSGANSGPPRRLSWRWLIATLLFVAIVTPAVYVWHRYQLKRVATAMLERADELEVAGEYRKASDYLFRCLQLSPQDSDRHRELTARIADSYDRSAAGNADRQSVISWYQRAVASANDPARNDELRLRLAELYMEVGEYQLAKSQVQQLGQQSPRSQRVIPLCRYREFERGVLQVRASVIADELEGLRQPGSIEIAKALARLQQDHLPPRDGIDRAEEADRVMDELVRNAAQHFASNNERRIRLSEVANPKDAYLALAHLARYEYELSYDRRPGGLDVERALELAPQNADVLLAAARQARETLAWPTAIDRYQQLLKTRTLLDSQRSRGYLGLGESHFRSGDPAAAIDTWEEGIGRVAQGRLPMLVRLVEALIGEKRLPAAARRLKQLDEAVSRLEMYGRRSNREWALAARDLCRARLQMAHDRFAEAATVLNRISLTARPTTGRRAEETLPYASSILLGQCLLELQKWPAAADSFEQALEFAPQSSTARIWAAKAWSAAGRDRAAIDLCEQVEKQGDVPENVLLMLAQLHLRDQLRLPPGDRNWRRLEEVLKDAATVLPDSWEIPLVRSNLLLVRDGASAVGGVLQILSATEAMHRDSIPLWSNLVFMYDRLQLPDEADRALENLERLEPNSIKPAAWRIALMANRGKFEEAEKALSLVAEGNRSEEEQIWIKRSQLSLAYQQGDSERVLEVLLEVHEAYPQNVEVLVQLADLAMTRNAWEDVENWCTRLRKAEGEDGIWWRWMEVRQSFAENPTPTPESWQLIDRRFNELRRIRPWWAGTSMVQGLVAEAQGRRPDASLAYAEAIQAGFSQPHVFEKLARSLYAEGRFDEAGQWLLQLQQQQPLDIRLLDLAWSSALQQNQTQWATRLARENLERHPDDPLAHVWMAQILLMNGEAQEADELVAKARELRPTDVASWAAMLTFYLQTGQPEPAADCLAMLEAHDELPPGQKYLLAAQSYAQLGKSKLARDNYRKAVEQLQGDAKALVLYAEFERAYDPARALELMREANKLDPKNNRARRLLAAWLYPDTDPEAERQAIRLLQQPDDNGRTAASDKRLEASLLMRRGKTGDLIRAQELLEELVSLPTVSDEDRLALAYLYERTQNVASARQQFDLLVQVASPPARNLAAYVDFLLRRRDLDAAQTQLERLENQAAMSLSAVSLRSRMFMAQGQDDLIDAHLESFARKRFETLEDPSERRQAMHQVARLFAAVGRKEGGKRWFKRLAAEFPRHNVDLATYLVVLDEMEQAVEFATDRVNEKLTSDTAALYAQVLIHANRDSTNWEQAEELLTEAYQRHGGDAKVLFSLASLRLKQGKTDDAISLLRELTEKHPQHVTGWNNLAAVLADDPNRLDDALVCVNRAIASAGRPIANLLDTKAVILLRQNENRAAAELMQRVLGLPRAVDPRFYFHLAVARQRLGNAQLAEQSWRRAVDTGLFKTYLTAYEKQLAAELAKAFGTQADTPARAAG